VTDDGCVPAGVDPTKPNVARVYDYSLGGKDNFAVDRAVEAEVLRLVPDARESAASARAFLRRVVRYMVAEAGIRQFIDVGSGLPTQGNVHEVAQEFDPRARVLYVDNDPVVLTHARALIEDKETTTVITADLRRPKEILDNPTVREFIDFDQPVGLLLISILHHINDDEDPDGIAAQLRAAMAPGSQLAIVHFYNPGSECPEDAALAVASEELFNKHFGTGRWRYRDEILAYFGDFELVEPGLVPLPIWRPDVTGRRTLHGAFRRTLGGVGRKV
jgi:hypothetical protein